MEYEILSMMIESNWDWYYPYHNAPTFHDIYLYLKEYKRYSTHIKFNKGKPNTPQTLLFMVLPPPSSIYGGTYKEQYLKINH